MPSTINGIGTHYYGKRNREKNAGVCEQCQRQVELENYETRLWFCVIFVPVIPLGRKQILNHCPACTMHQAVPYADWDNLRKEAIGESADELRSNQDDPEAGLKMLGTLAAFHKTDEATKLARMMRDQHEDHALVQFSVGGWLEQQGHGEEATACFERAWKLEPDTPEYRRAWGMTLAEQGNLGEARELLTLFEQPETLDAGTIYFLANHCQKFGDHKQALELYSRLLEVAPALGKDKDFRKAVRESENAIGGEESILPRRSIFSSKAFWWTAAACLLIGGVAVASFAIASNRTVHILNGAAVPISVAIDGEAPVAIGPLSRATMQLPEAAHAWKLTEPEALAGEGQFELKTGFFARLFESPVFVLDPGRTAVTVYEHAVYAEVAENAQHSSRVHVGQPFLIFDDIDLAFEPFPDEIRGERSDMERTRVDAILFEPSQVIGAVQNDMTAQQQFDLCEQHLRAQPSNEDLLEIYGFFAFKQNAIQRVHDFLQSRIEERPIEISWHRMYQSTASTIGRDDELFAEYDRLLDDDPEDSALLYLRGRIEPDSRLAGDLYDRAIAADSTNAFPLMAKAHRAVSLAEFEEARDASNRALELRQDHNTERVRFWARVALKDFDVVEKESRAALAEAPLNATAHFRLLTVLAVQERVAQLKQAQDAYALAVKSQFAKDPFDSIPQSERFVAMCQGDHEKALEITRRMSASAIRSRFEAECLVELKRFGELQKLQFAEAENRGFAELYESVVEALNSTNVTWTESESAQRALASLRGGNSETQMVAAVLASAANDGDSVYEKVIGITLQPPQRIAVCLAAAVQLTGESRTQLLDLAERLNFMPTHPRYIAKFCIDSLR